MTKFQLIQKLMEKSNNLAQQAGVNSYPGWKSGEWHHVACTWSAGGLAIYLDGVLARGHRERGSVVGSPGRRQPGAAREGTSCTSTSSTTSRTRSRRSR